ncbi:ABC transporter permease [Pseudoxanthomonas kalamensis DSM 18571]|uniref:ABC transporter permease n=1 Tax=Pseudoxanthomonas kalamensis TaxID=289483 RepID=UPI001391D03A|nr:ABC transporter permease [Pseudoxanthomonas kalamensis]KAF1710560.1 ABC transporter permease [Pseudoxanthomonas kalamensis DSM 18571]
MNAVTTPHKTQTMKWLLKREFWENRGGFLWAPAITGIIITALFTLLAIIGSIAGRRAAGDSGFVIDDAPDKINLAIGGFGDGVLLAGVMLACAVLAFVVFFYALGSLYDDRRDRSILFWKSLPLSDRDMVLSKAAWALLLAPVIAIGIGILIGLALWVVTALTLTVNGLPASTAVFTHSHPLRIVGGALACLPVYVLWALPTVGWLMFCSAWARSKPFLWAVLVPLLGCVTVSMMGILPNVRIPHDTIWYVVAYRGLLSVAPGTWVPTLSNGTLNPSVEINTPDELAKAVDLTRSWEVFAHADIWIGAAVGIALIVAAIYLRRWRDEG